MRSPKLTRRTSPWLLFPVLFALSALQAHAVGWKWVQPTPEELALRAEPKAPGAPAIILSWEESGDGDTGEQMVHVRLKVLTGGGLDAGNLVRPETVTSSDLFSHIFFARTIHPDGSIVAFSGVPRDATLRNPDGTTRKIVSMPSVTVGSILEYGFHLQASWANENRWHEVYYAPVWHVQQRFFVRQAHYTLEKPYHLEPEDIRWMARLPPGFAPQRVKNRVELNVSDVPAAPDEEFMPPPSSTSYGVWLFYQSTRDDHFWGVTGNRVDSVLTPYYQPTRILREAAGHLLQPEDTTDQKKLSRLFRAVQAMENTGYTREHSRREDKAEHLKTSENSDATWTNRRGDPEELTLLFVALARAAGYKAYPVAVASRGHAILNQEMHSWDQVDDLVAMVTLGDGQTVFFDPGTRGCAAAHLAPQHAAVLGIAPEEKTIAFIKTSADGFRYFDIERKADLTLSPAGQVTGKASLAWIGNAGLKLRQLAWAGDERDARQAIETEIQGLLPVGLDVKLDKLSGLDDGEVPLFAIFTVSGTIGESTASRLVLPAQLFASRSRPLLTASTRTLPVAFPAGSVTHDLVQLHLPAGFNAEALPEPHTAALKPGAGPANAVPDVAYKSTVQYGASKQFPGQRLIVAERTALLNRLDYKPEEYPSLHKYFSDIATFDADQIVLQQASAAAPATR